MSDFFKRELSFFSIPSFKHCLISVFLCFAFFMPLCGTLPLLAMLGVFQVCFTLIVLIAYRRGVIDVIQYCRHSSPKLIALFIAWLLSSIISYVLIMFETSLVWQMLGATGRQAYILLQSFYVIAIAVFLRSVRVTLMQVLLLLTLGLLLMLGFMIWLYQTEAVHDSWIWFFNPLFVVHIRDLGNVAVVAALVLSIHFLFSSRLSLLHQTACLFALSVVFTFILWAGGRMAVFAFCFTFLWVLILAKYLRIISTKSIVLLFLALTLSFFLLEFVAVFDWNGIARSSNTLTDFQGISESDGALLNKISTGRWKMWSMSLNAVAESPFFGLGPYGYYFIPERSYGDQPHNLIIQFLVEWGVVGAGLVILLLIGLCVKSIKGLRQAFLQLDKDYIAGFAIVMALTIHALTGGTYFNVQPMYCLTLGFSGLCFSRYISKISSLEKTI